VPSLVKILVQKIVLMANIEFWNEKYHTLVPGIKVKGNNIWYKAL